MPAISSTLSSNFTLRMLPMKMAKGASLNFTYRPCNVRPPFTPRKSNLYVKLDNFQDPLMINDLEKEEDHELSGRYAYDEYVVGQRFLVRLYELDIHQKASLEALLNYTEETGLNLFQSSGLVVVGFAVSKEMTSRNLIWVIGKIQVALNSYPSWGDIVQVETWCSGLSRHTLTCSSRLTNAKTGEKLMRVDSEFVMINEKTRRLSKIPEEIKAKGDPYVRKHLDPLLIPHKPEIFKKLRKIHEHEADHIVTGIRPLWFDLDPNQHVNNVKYISWILEGTPESVRESYELVAIGIEYRRECLRADVLRSLSIASRETPMEFDHLLCLEDGIEVARAKTLWRARPV